jgi:integrase
MPQRCVDALRRHRDHSPHPPPDALVFATANGTALDTHNVRRSFHRMIAAADLNRTAWTPRELRHSFVSLLSASGVVMHAPEWSRRRRHAASNAIQPVHTLIMKTGL